MVFVNSLKPRFYQVNILLRRGDPGLRLFLKSMQYVDRITEFDGVNRPVGVTVMVFDYLQHSSAGKAFDRFCGRMFAAGLGKVESIAHHILYIIREFIEVTFR
jgi:hypothetical protein